METIEKRGILEKAAATAEMLRANARAQAEIRGMIKEVDAEIEQITREMKTRPRGRAVRDLGRRRPYKINVKAPNTPEANHAGLGIAEACEGCGFRVEGASDFDAQEGTGVYIESGLGMAQIALLIQGAFQIAELDATLLIHEFACVDGVTIHVRESGLRN